jgi:hypothetical protein
MRRQPLCAGNLHVMFLALNKPNQAKSFSISAKSERTAPQSPQAVSALQIGVDARVAGSKFGIDSGFHGSAYSGRADESPVHAGQAEEDFAASVSTQRGFHAPPS